MDLAQKIAEEIYELGIREDDCILVHAGVRDIIRELSSKSLSPAQQLHLACSALYDGLMDILGPDGTLCVPGYFYDYARFGAAFDARFSPPDRSLGAFAKFFFNEKMTGRSSCPSVSLMATGSRAGEVCAHARVPFGFGSLSPWEKLVDLDGAMIFTGASINRMTFVHHAESKAGVPHLYNKIYDSPITDFQGDRVEFAVSAVRYLDERFGIIPDFSQLEIDMRAEGLLSEKTLFSSPLCVVRFKDAFNFILERLRQNPFYLLSSRPRFEPGLIPLDGLTGPQNQKLANPN